MKILQISTYDIKGGAARAAYRLHRGLRGMGHDCRMVVRYKDTLDESVWRIVPRPNRQRDDRGFFLDVVIQGQYIDAHRTDISNTLFSLPYPGYDLSRLPMAQEADIINLHWVAQYQSPLTLKRLFDLGLPVIWTLHDQWPFTGGCHYAAGCERYRGECDGCPQLSDDPFGLPGAVLKDKKSFFKDARLTIVTPSRWMAGCARESSLFRDLRVEVIPNSLEVDVFAPIPKKEAKVHFGLSADTCTLLFGAEYGTEKRKGLIELRSAVASCLADHRFQDLLQRDRVKMICFGNPGADLTSTGIPVISLGYRRSDEEVRLAYSAADIFVQASLEDNLPNTLLESMSCGTPVVAFDVGGMPDLVEDGATGRLVPFRDTFQMGEAIRSLLFDPDRRERMGKECRKRMENGFALSVQARGYSDLYQELIGETGVKKAPLLCETTADSAPVDSEAGGPNLLTAHQAPGVGVHLNAVYRGIVSKSSMEFAPYAHAKWQAAEVDRDARLTVIGGQSQRISSLESEVDRWLRETRRLQEAHRLLEAERNELRSYADHLRRQIETIEADRDARLAVIGGQSERISRLESEVDRWLGETRRLQEAYGLVEAERNELNSYTDHLRRQIGSIEVERNELRNCREILRQQIDAIEADRAARLDVIETQGARIAELEADIGRRFWSKKRLQAFVSMEEERNELRLYADHLHQQIGACEADRAARLEVIEAQGARISQLESEVDRWLGETKRLQQAHGLVEAERNELKSYVEHLLTQIRGIETERNELMAYKESLHERVEEIEADRAARLEVIEAQGARISQLESEVDRWLMETKRLQQGDLELDPRPDGQETTGCVDVPGRLKAFEKAIKRRFSGQLRSMAKAGTTSPGRSLASLKREIDAFNDSQANKTLLDDIRLFNHKMIDQFDDNFPLKGSMFLDIGASPHGYAMERALEKGVACYVGIGLDIGQHEYVIGEAANAGILLNMDATALKFPDAFFDAVLSASVFEHIIDVSAALREIDRVLKPGGCALISFEPIWSCSYGHHLHHLAGCSDLIPPWAHLIWTRDQMTAFLSDKWPQTALLSLNQAIDWIYSGDAINRLNVREFRELFASCPLEVVWMVEMRDENQSFDPSTIRQCSDATGLHPDELTTKGLSLLLTKK